MVKPARSRRRVPAPRYADPSLYEAFTTNARALVDQARGLLARNEGSRRSCLETLFRDNVSLACIGLILGWDRVAIRHHLDEGLRGGLDLLACEAPRRPTPAVYIDVHLSGGAVVQTDTRFESLPAERAVSNILYEDVLACAIAFGSPEQSRAVASYPSERYRQAGLITPEAFYTMLEAEKVYVKGDRATARALAREAMQDERLRVRGAPTVALLDGDWVAFEMSLAELLRSHRRERKGADPRAAMSMLGMALCRWAMQDGYVPEEGPYLPLFLLRSDLPAAPRIINPPGEA